MELNQEHFTEVIGEISRREATDVMDQDDLQQELWVYLLERYSKIENEGQMVTLLKKQARTITKQERIDYMHFRGAFIYTPGMVRTLLADAVWCEVEDAFDIEGRVDVTRALGELPYRTQRLLYSRFALGEKPERKSATEKAIERAVDTITTTLNFRSEAEQVDETYILDPHTIGGSSF